MAEAVLMPKLGATMEEGTIIKWLVEEGDPVNEGDPILEIMTDKVNLEVEAPASGLLLKQLYEPDTIVEVLKPIAYIGESVDDLEGLEIETEKVASQTDEEMEKVEVSEKTTHKVAETEDVAVSTPPHLIRRTPAARKLANEKGVSLEDIEGTGPNNRIHLVDVENHLRKLAKSEGPQIQPTLTDEDQIHRDLVPLSGVRKVIAERLSESWNSAPHVSMNTKIDMTETINIRKQLLPMIEESTSYRLSFTEIIMKATAAALQDNIIINSTLEGDNIILHRDVHLGLAVAIPNGLVVPVIHHVNNKGLADLTSESKELAKAAKTNRLLPEQMANATFTISNLGMYAVDSFTPIINQPQTAILGVSQINEEVVSVDGTFKTRPMCTLTLSFDHRIIDGAPAAKFLTDLKNKLENPYTLLF